MLLIATAQGLVALALAMQILHSMCLSLPVIPVTKAHWPMLPTVLLSQVLTGMQVYVSTCAWKRPKPNNVHYWSTWSQLVHAGMHEMSFPQKPYLHIGGLSYW